MSCRVLGELKLQVDGAPVEVRGVRLRRLLTALVLADGHPVADDELADLLWPEKAPADVLKGLRVLVWRLRSALGSAGDCLQRTPSGYCLVVASDHRRFADLVASGLYRVSIRDSVGGVQELGEALALWRGEPWQDLAAVGRVDGARARLVELRELALEEREAGRLAMGNGWVAVRSLTRLVADSPYRERRWELLARGYLEIGQPDRAYAELRRFRTLLADGLGLDPGPTLTALERRLGESATVVPRRVAWRWR